MWRSGEAGAVISLLARLAEEYPDAPPIRGMLGGYLEDLGRHREALPHLDASVRLSPGSELASITRFHAHWAVGRESDAWAEARRFISVGASGEYEQLFVELGERPD